MHVFMVTCHVMMTKVSKTIIEEKNKYGNNKQTHDKTALHVVRTYVRVLVLVYVCLCVNVRMCVRLPPA